MVSEVVKSVSAQEEITEVVQNSTKLVGGINLC